MILEHDKRHGSLCQNLRALLLIAFRKNFASVFQVVGFLEDSGSRLSGSHGEVKGEYLGRHSKIFLKKITYCIYIYISI